MSSAEVNFKHVVRPHLFHVPEVSGITVPVRTMEEGKLHGQWKIYLRWQDGKREAINFVPSIEMSEVSEGSEMSEVSEGSGGERLCFSPVPGVPSHQGMGRWSAKGREDWLKGSKPDLKDVFSRLTTTFDHFLEFPPDQREGSVALLALWTILTYFYPCCPAVPYIHVFGQFACGKSRVMEIGIMETT